MSAGTKIEWCQLPRQGFVVMPNSPEGVYVYWGRKDAELMALVCGSAHSVQAVRVVPVGKRKAKKGRKARRK